MTSRALATHIFGDVCCSSLRASIFDACRVAFLGFDGATARLTNVLIHTCQTISALGSQIPPGVKRSMGHGGSANQVDFNGRCVRFLKPAQRQLVCAITR